MIDAGAIVFLPRGVRTHKDKVRGMDVLLGPERVLMLEPVGVAILSELNGKAPVAQIVDTLSRTYDAPRDVIEPDVIEFLRDLYEKGFVHVSPG